MASRHSMTSAGRHSRVCAQAASLQHNCAYVVSITMHLVCNGLQLAQYGNLSLSPCPELSGIVSHTQSSFDGSSHHQCNAADISRKYIKDPELLRFIDLECYIWSTVPAELTPMMNAGMVGAKALSKPGFYRANTREGLCATSGPLCLLS
eukprot:1157553-Pelagomonas_calceolata.AAC.8